MALRNIRYNDDPQLRKKAREITDINEKIEQLSKDMFETMYEAEGVGLAGPQIGILKRIIVMDFGEEPNVIINPEIIEEKGSCIAAEACLSFPHLAGEVERPEEITVSYTKLNGERVTETHDGIQARCFCHEIDHLNGIVYVDKAIEGTLEEV